MLGKLACDCCSSWVEVFTAKLCETQLRGHGELREGSAGGQLGNHGQERKTGGVAGLDQNKNKKM